MAEPRSVTGLGSVTGVAARALTAIVLVAFVLRVGLAVALPNASYPDETFQTREAAHRLAYGYGVTEYEWREGLRSWVLPGFLAGVMRATDWMGPGSAGYLLGLVIVLSLISLTSVWFSFLWAYRTSGLVAAIIAGGASATWYMLVYYGPKALYEVVAAHVLLPGLYLGAFGTAMPERRRLFFAGMFCGLALCLRPPLAPAAVFAAVVFAYPDPRRRVGPIAAGLFAPVLFFGLVDAATWAYPFESYVRFLSVNVYQRGGVQWDPEQWARPWYWFLPVLGLSLGPMAAFALVGLRRAPFLGWVAAVVLVTHSVVAHKEARFIYPIIPLAITLAGLGLADVLSAVSAWWGRARSPVAASAVGVACCLCVSGVLARFFPLWSRYSGNLIAFETLSRDRSLCGVGLQIVYGLSGGYTYLHRDVPIYQTEHQAEIERLAPAFNAIVASRRVTYDGFVLERCWNGTCLYRRPGGCTASRADEINTYLKRRNL